MRYKTKSFICLYHSYRSLFFSCMLSAEVMTVLMLLPVSPLAVDIHGSESVPTCRGRDSVDVVTCFSSDS